MMLRKAAKDSRVKSERLEEEMETKAKDYKSYYELRLPASKRLSLIYESKSRKLVLEKR
jgi:hypothetical protein